MTSKRKQNTVSTYQSDDPILINSTSNISCTRRNLAEQVNNWTTFLTFRAFRSLLNCRAYGFSDIEFKVVTAINIMKKIFNNFPVKARVDFTPWIFKKTTVTVSFKGFEYSFSCPFQCDSNIFLNPYYHEYDVPVVITTVMQKGDVFIDVGAHCGLYTLLAGKIIGSSGKAVAVEPNPFNLQLLKINIQLNKLNNVRIVPKAAGERASKVKIYFDDGKTAFSSALKHSGHVVSVETVKLDDILEDQAPVKLLKIDTEGLDLEVLLGAEETLRRTFYLIVEQTGPEIIHFLMKRDFNLYLLSASKNLLAVKKKKSLSPILAKLSSRVGFASCQT